MPHFLIKFPSYGDGIDRMRDFFLSTDIYRVLSLIEEWIRSGMQMPPEEFASALRSSYIVYATWTAEVASGQSATLFPEEMFESVKYLKK